MTAVVTLTASLVPVSAWGATAPDATPQPTPAPTGEPAPSDSPTPVPSIESTPAPDPSPSPETTDAPVPEPSDSAPAETPEQLTQEELDRLGGDSTPDEAVVEEGADKVFRTKSLTGWNAGNIISDSVFFNSGTMSAGQIQSFLNGKVAACRSGYVCLKDFRQSTPSRAADRFCPSAYTGATNESAATIIAKVAQACGINPQVLLVMLQK